jgi:hypothetical protein
LVENRRLFSLYVMHFRRAIRNPRKRIRSFISINKLASCLSSFNLALNHEEE